MRRITSHIERLAAPPFILLVGLVYGAIQGVPRFWLSGGVGTGLHLAQFVIVGVTSVLWWTAALLLWWISVRRRGWSLWTTAAHVTLGLALGDVLSLRSFGFPYGPLVQRRRLRWGAI